MPNDTLGQTVRWVAPIGWTGSTGNGSSSNAPLVFSFATVNGWLLNSSMGDLTVMFLPGTYLISDTVNPGSAHHRFVIGGDGNRVVRLVGVADSAGNWPKMVLAPKPVNTWPNDNWPPAFGSDTLITTSSTPTPTPYFDGISYREYLGRIDVENFELDGNFEGQRVRTSAANSSGYKSSAFSLTARTGRLRNLRLRNFGSCGQVPYSLVEGDLAGIESFPVFVGTLDDLTKPAFTDAPWVIEDVEVSEFRSRFGGYGTMFMAASFLVNNPNAPYDPNPLVLFRRCMVNGANTIGFGTAGMPGLRSGRIRFEDCVTLNSSIGFNTDTLSCGPLTIANSVFFDLNYFGMLGEPESGPNHRVYRLHDNLMRIRGRDNRPTYADFYIVDANDWGTNPNLPLGRLETSRAEGLVFQGAASDIVFTNNRITTWPVTNFFLPDPVNGTAQALFSPIWVIPSETPINTQWYSRVRNPAVNVTLSDGRLSTTAFDFTGSSVWPTYNNLSQLLPTSAPEYTASRSALATLPSGFAPQGRVERVVPRFGGSGNKLLGVLEAAVGQTSVSGTSLTVTVRAAEHRTPASGSPGTIVLATNLWIAVDQTLPDGVSATLGPVAVATAAGNGTASTTFNLANANASVRIRTWMAPSSSSAFAPDQMAWGSHTLSVGTVVSLVASPDVGDDKNTAPAKRAKLRFTRSGSTNNALTVQFVLPATSAPTFDLVTPINLRNLIATYGTGSSGDYTLVSGTPGATLTLAAANSGGINTVLLPAGVAEAVVDVVIRLDNVTEGNVVRAELLPASVYALSPRTRADVHLYDGPLWNLVELRLDNLGSTYSSFAYALNELNGTTQSRIAGSGTFFSGAYETRGGSWQWPATSTFNSAYTAVYYGISTSPTWLVGIQGNNAVKVMPNSSGFASLPHLNSGPSGAWGISPNSTYIAGFSGTPQRPVAWPNNGSPVNLAQNFTDSDGQAMGANSAGEIVGYTLLTLIPGTPGYRPFRTKPGAAALAANQEDTLPPPVVPGGSIDGSGVSYSVNTTGGAVGAFLYDTFLYKRAAYWPPRISPSAPNSPGIDLKAWHPRWQNPQYTMDPLSEALAINDSNWIAGWSGSVTATRAIVRSGVSAHWNDLNDRHWVSGSSGWSLRKATAINNQQIIVGNGVLNGSQRAFVLVPRAQGQ